MTELDWPTKQRVYLTLDLECDFGTLLAANTLSPGANSYAAARHTDRLADLLDRLSVPLTCFVQTDLLDEQPEAVEALRAAGVEVRFHPHSHTHRHRSRTSIGYEVETSTDRYREFFDSDPVGYRFPNGDVRVEDYRYLADAEYRFDASVFPTWRPGHFDNTDQPRTPQYLSEFDLYEIPFTVSGAWLPIPTSLSFCRLFGRPYTELLLRRPPPVVVFNVHMHDLVTPPSVAELPRRYRAVYARNDRGFDMLEGILRRFKRQGYRFGHVDNVHELLRP
ncbi:Peptidoglycan/xylan/chitin deacetylase, PgdA/CDA1 family [Halapricum desulfuricans]|uniref:Peptidoglycan/xylan/chitin deacetylase, PgdA/CDA1 family n=1 Tax=Halapricum desulfuricans TaxID=2841257 RepID=A0A897NF65_9EURY|nr:polysaccharide deacetylase family protein [Halapricum desulfuricans]QSG11337.1 Peptidoglycan/xylan/chitin deacetylase, PgdA/CDA1 family [Halapricum desulfuricans]